MVCYKRVVHIRIFLFLAYTTYHVCPPSPPLKHTRQTFYANNDIYTWLGLLLSSYDGNIRVAREVENVAVQ